MKDLRILLKKLDWKTEGRIFGFGTSPEADWRIIFISFVVLAIVVIVFSFFMFREIGRGDIFVTKAPGIQEEQVLDTSLLKETVSYYQNKALELKKLKSSTSSDADPSVTN